MLALPAPGVALQLALTFAAATAAGYLARWLRVPGGLLVGALLGAAAVTLAMGPLESPPRVLSVAVPLGVGLITGVLVTRDVARRLPPLLLPALGSAVVLVLAGLGLAALLRGFGVPAATATMATSPGALSVLVAAAVGEGTAEVEVALFHLVRLILVILTAPLLVAATRRLER